MRVSKKFLNEYIDIEAIDYHELAEKMVCAGNEYESIGKISEAKGLVIGHVLECSMHPKSDKLHICKVDIGAGQVKQILCGAFNFKTGDKVIVSPVGAILPGGIEIKKATLAGMESNGMICSLSEIGIETKYQNEEERVGIHVLPEDAPVGENAISYMGYDDEVIDFELTANRADLMSMLGMAYEVGAIYGLDVTEPKIEFKEQGESIEKKHTLEVKTEDCSIYLGRLVSHIQIGESPMFIQTRLMASGIRPINNVVDISNYVMLEYGQPLHFFDASHLGKQVIVRHAKENEALVTLDGVERTLSETDLVIANKSGAVALAGVMGGKATEVNDTTTQVFIESAIFNPLAIRSTSKKILRSEASSRYEKGIDPNITEKAINRACQLLEQYASGHVHPGILKRDTARKDSLEISVSLAKINAILGMNLNMDEVSDIFTRLHFSHSKTGEEFIVTVPTRRLDVKIVEDLIEEIGRIYGYEHVEGILPTVPIKEGTYSKKARFIKMIRNRFQAFGLNQVITYSLIGEAESNQFINEPYEKVVLNNPMSEDKKIMRNSMIPSLLTVFEYNVARNMKEIAIFETGSCYSKKDEYVEETKVSGLLYGNAIQNIWMQKSIPYDFYFVKGLLEELFRYLGLQGRYDFVKEECCDMHPGMTAVILVDQEKVGYFGRVSPNRSKKDVYVFELSIDLLMKKQVRNIKFKEPSKYPAVSRDVAFIIPKEMSVDAITKQIQKSGGRFLSNLDIFDVYVGENIKTEEKSVAYSFILSDSTKTLTDEFITEIFQKIIHDVEQKFSVKLRDK